MRTGEMAKALDAQTQSLALARNVGDRLSEGRTLIPMGDLYLLLGEKEKARDALTRALELARAAGDPVGEAAALRRVGRLLAAGGDWRQAIDLLQRSLSLARATGDLQGERDALVNLAQTERERDNLIAARDYHEKALALTESLRAKILHLELRASYLATRQDEYELYADLLMELHQQQPNAGYAAAAFEVSERGRARSLLEMLAEARADIRQGVDAGLLAEERKLADRIRVKERQHAQLIGNDRAAKQREALAKEIGDLLNGYQSLQGRIRASSPRYAALTQPRPLSAARLQQLLDENTILLESSLGETRSWLWAITPDAITSHALPPRDAIETSARKIHELLIARQPKKGESNAERESRIAGADSKFTKEAGYLSQMLLGGIAGKLRQDWKEKRLLIVASGMLEYLPFAALPLPGQSTNQLLIANHEVVHLPSASVLAVIRREAGGRQAAAKMLAVPADLVVLSACQTALGKEIKGEGLVGLTRGFMYAGAQRVVASLWQVDDQATALLMQHFYRGMLKENLRPAAALRAAQIEMSKQKRWSSPYYWAGFVMQGEYR